MTTHNLSDLKILILEDSPDDAELLTAALKSNDPRWSVLTVNSRTGFTQALDNFVPDVVLSDHAVPAFNGHDALQLIQERQPGTPFLLVAGAFEEIASACLKAGASDFISKSDLHRLIPAIRAEVTLREPLRKLSQRQLEVLHLLAQGLSTREIAGKLQVSIKTIETHRAQVMRRLAIHDVAGLVRYAIRVGLVPASR
jgi:DNA-binding NarL/FixJ family response regulator